jgi:hypothetical protein
MGHTESKTALLMVLEAFIRAMVFNWERVWIISKLSTQRFQAKNQKDLKCLAHPWVPLQWDHIPMQWKKQALKLCNLLQFNQMITGTRSSCIMLKLITKSKKMLNKKQEKTKWRWKRSWNARSIFRRKSKKRNERKNRNISCKHRKQMHKRKK